MNCPICGGFMVDQGVSWHCFGCGYHHPKASKRSSIGSSEWERGHPLWVLPRCDRDTR